MAKPSPSSDFSGPSRPRLLVVELWGLGDLALALPFLRAASRHSRVTLLAMPLAAQLLARFAPDVELIPCNVPWTAFTGKYRLHEWPWRALNSLRRTLRERHFDVAVSARHDPRDHALLALSGATRRLGFPRIGSGALLTTPLPAPPKPHRAEHWRALATALGWTLPATPVESPSFRARRIVIHPGARRAVRVWPFERYQEIARRLAALGWEPVMLDPDTRDIDELIDALATADRFLGNDSGPGHLAALLGVPTFTIFGPQLPELFAPQHPQAEWVEGGPCPHKPCFDSCRYATPHCLLSVDVETVWLSLEPWLNSAPSPLSGGAVPLTAI